MTKLLLVEDDNNLREIYEARLAAEGYEIITAKDGEEALEVAKKNKPELIISDVMMPRISGFEMLDILRNTDGLRNTKIIMLTALGQAEDKTRADSLGADRYLVKSQVTLEDIVKAAAELLNPGAAVEEAPIATASEQPTPAAASEPASPAPAAEPVTAAPAPTADTPTPQPEPAAPQAVPVTSAPDDPTTTPAPATQAVPVPDSAPADNTQQPAAPTQAIPVTDTPAATPEPVQPEPAVVSPVAEPADDQKDAIINAAINDLSSDTANDAAAAQPTEPASPAPAADENTDPQGPKQKVISPISPSPEEAAKPDLATLLAQEEGGDGAASAGQSAPTPPAHQPNTVFKPNDNGNSNDVAL